MAKVSIVGSGMISNPGVAAKMFEVLAQYRIQIKMVSTSEIKVSAVVEEKKMVKAVEALHEAFELGEAASVSMNKLVSMHGFIIKCTTFYEFDVLAQGTHCAPRSFSLF